MDGRSRRGVGKDGLANSRLGFDAKSLQLSARDTRALPDGGDVAARGWRGGIARRREWSAPETVVDLLVMAARLGASITVMGAPQDLRQRNFTAALKTYV